MCMCVVYCECVMYIMCTDGLHSLLKWSIKCVNIVDKWTLCVLVSDTFSLHVFV